MTRWIATAETMFDHPLVGMMVPPPPPADEARHAIQPMIAWQDLIRSAAWKAHKVHHKGKVVSLDRGQFLAGRRFWAERWNWGEKSVRNFFERLAEHGMLAVVGQSKGHVANVLSICNYEKFQSSDRDEGQKEGQKEGQRWASGGPVVGQTVPRNTNTTNNIPPTPQVASDDALREDAKTNDQVAALQVAATSLRQTDARPATPLPTYCDDSWPAYRGDDGLPKLTPKDRAFWLTKFDNDDGRLDIALAECVPEYPQKTAGAYSNGVVRRLGQIAGRRSDSARNYAKAVERNRSGKPVTGEVPFKPNPHVAMHLKPAPEAY